MKKDCPVHNLSGTITTKTPIMEAQTMIPDNSGSVILDCSCEQDWQEQFDKEFGSTLIEQKAKVYNDGSYSKGYKKDWKSAEEEVNKLKDFIQQHRTQLLEELLREVEELLKMEKIVIREMKRDKVKSSRDFAYSDGTVDTLKDLSEVLKEKL